MSIIASWQEKSKGTIFAGAFGAVALGAMVIAQAPLLSTDIAGPAPASASRASGDLTTSVADAVGSFVEGMADRDIDVVWTFASEEDQAAFGTESAIYEAYADAFPQLTDVAEVHVGTVRDEGDTPFVPVVLQDNAGASWVANFGFWKNDAGDWTLISLDIKPASDNSV
jgi:hypothetical protein